MRPMHEPTIIFALNFNGEDYKIKELEYVRNYVCPYARQMEGHYKGEMELSYVCLLEEIIDWNELVNVLMLTMQESILVIDNEGNGNLYYAEDKYVHGEHTVHLGMFKRISKETALSLDAYTFDENENRYYPC